MSRRIYRTATRSKAPAEANFIRHYDFLMIDIVGYSLLSGEDQVGAIKRLMDVVRKSDPIATTIDGKDRIFLPTGDGMVVGFIGLPTKPLELAVEVHKAYGPDRRTLKMGIQSGIAFQVEDINGSHNVAGSGINMAARVLSCCNGGHILVAREPGETLKNEYAAWRNQLLGPFEFVVKHGKSLVAYNLTDRSSYGNPEESFHNLYFKGSYAGLKTRLVERGITPARGLLTFASSSAEYLVIDEVIIDLPIAGFAGVPPDKLAVRMLPGNPELPEQVLEARALLPPPSLNRPKLFLTHISPPISDKDGTLTLEVVLSDFQTLRAIEQCAGQIQEGILKGEPPLGGFPRRLDCPIVVLTADRKLVMCKRGPRDVVRYFPLTWEVSVGESVDAEHDCGAGLFDPTRTVRRGLSEELGLPENVASDAQISFAAIATEWRILAANLISIVRLNKVESMQVRDWFPGALDREHTDIDMIDFSDPDVAIAILFSGRHSCHDTPNTDARLNNISRVALLVTLFNVFGYQRIMSLI